MTTGTKLHFCAGEPSGDTHAARVIEELRALDPGLQCRGLGGPRMEAAGMQLDEDLASDAIMGLFPVIKALPRIWKTFHATLDRLREDRPDALVLVDYPGFNIRLAAKAKAMGIPVIYYISPQVWAWARGRIKKIARIVDLMLVILPFEADIYRDSGLRSLYVGHPLLDHLARTAPDPELVAELRAGEGPLCGIFPGSRRHVLESLLPVFFETAQRLRAMPGMESTRFAVALAQERFRPLIEEALPEGLPCTIVCDHSREVMEAADLCLSSSGTTTLEIAGSGTPFVIGYKVSFLFYWIARMLISVPYIGLVNLVAGKRVVPEFVSWRSFAQDAAKELHRLGTDETVRKEQETQLAKVRDTLGDEGSYQRAAAAILEFMTPPAPRSP